MSLDPLSIQDHTLSWGTRTYLMGILNITPDSFSGDGLLAVIDHDSLANQSNSTNLIDSAILRAREFVQAGVDIIDVGGESTRPGSESVTVQNELDLVVPVILELANEFDILISIDTYKSAVAEAALQAGAHIVNDVWGLKADQKMAAVVAKNNSPVIIMHNRSSWMHAEVKENLGGRYVGMEYGNLLEDIKRELLDSVALANAAGIPDELIILDPGIGFGKTIEQNLEIINHLNEFRQLGYPILSGPSRKSFIGYTLDLPPGERLSGSAAAVAVSITRGADIVRVHDVQFMSKVTKMTDAIVRCGDKNQTANL
jgi:dihydropteroate synthase